MQPKVKEALHDIWMAESRDKAKAAFDSAITRFGAKYPQAMSCLEKDREELLAFYDFPAEHWKHMRSKGCFVKVSDMRNLASFPQ